MFTHLRVVGRTVVIAAVVLSFSRCASIEQYPRRTCLYFSDKRFVTGTIIEKRDDGARLFKFDDRSQGDQGYRWVEDGDSVTFRPCAAASALTPTAADTLFGRNPE